MMYPFKRNVNVFNYFSNYTVKTYTYMVIVKERLSKSLLSLNQYRKRNYCKKHK